MMNDEERATRLCSSFLLLTSDSLFPSLAEDKVHHNLGLNLDWFTIQERWLIAPARHCIRRRVYQERVALQDLQVLHRSVPGYHRLQSDRTLHARHHCQRRICRFRAEDE